MSKLCKILIFLKKFKKKEEIRNFPVINIYEGRNLKYTLKIKKYK